MRILYEDVELNAMIMAAGHSSHPHLAGRLQELRGAWLGYSSYAKEREAKEAALLQEVERVDRAAARISIETERLRRLRDEAMDIVRRVEPQLVEDSPTRPSSGRSVTQDDDMLYLNKDLKHVRDLMLSEHLHDSDDSGPRLTQMMGTSGPRLRRHGSSGSLLTSSPMSRAMPPPMPLMNNWGMYQGPGGYYPPAPHDGGYPRYDEHYGYHPHMYNGQPPPPGPYADQYPPQPPMSQSQMRWMYEHGHHPRGHPRYDRDNRDMSSEGENTSNDACDLSSSEASGSGRRRKNKKFPAVTKSERRKSKSSSRSRKSCSQSPREDDRDKANPIRGTNPDEKNTGDQNPEPDIKKLSAKKDGDARNDGPGSPKEDPVEKQQPAFVQKEIIKQPAVSVPSRVNSKSEQLMRMESEQKIVLESGDEEDGKLYSSESSVREPEVQDTESSIREPEVQEKKTSLDRERKVGVGPRQNSVVETNAYQMMMHGGVKKPAPVVIDDETSSDDIEAQVAIPKPRTNFMSGSGGLHNMEDESFGDSSPGQNKQRNQTDHIIEAEPLKMTGMGGNMGFGLPGIGGGLAGGRLGHPLAQRAGMMALASSANTGHQHEDAGQLSAPDNDDDDDFWG